MTFHLHNLFAFSNSLDSLDSKNEQEEGMAVLRTALALIATNDSNAIAPQQTDQSILSVICAWPVSGQYGPGSRILQVTFSLSSTQA